MRSIFNSNWAYIPYHIHPVAFSIGPVRVHWYGLMYLTAFFIVYFLVLYRIRTESLSYSKESILDFMFLAIACLFAGGRLGYVLFYNLPYYLANPIKIISPFSFSNGIHYTGIYGMSFHGALIGVFLAFMYYCRKNKMNPWRFIDLFVPAIPLGYTFGRIGNFINGELYGRVTTVPWGMYFPLDGTHQLRHPSQLYEAFFEGIVLFVVLWNLRKVRSFDGFLSAGYLIGYGTFRFFIEFFRQPDPQLGFVLGPFSMGQILCFIMVVAGTAILAGHRKDFLRR
ncbi:MAG: prolipoprotein diacylglyceryl transferase [Candidatus Omnitrophica bacterium]|nr:prolipoprotein diacylglyceryl transferase [Candidatus Omnitrophota bacterium]